MSHYGNLYPEYFGGDTGLRIAELGGANAQVVGLYLTSNNDATMIGLYPIELIVMRARIASLKPKQIIDALAALEAADFALFDAGTGFVWVKEMAKYRLQLNLRPLDPHDNRVKHAQKKYAECRPNPFLGPFFDRYRKDLHLQKRRDFEGDRKALGEPLRRGLQGASKPVTEAGAGTGPGSATGNSRPQSEQGDQDQRADSRAAFAYVVKRAHEVLDQRDAGTIPDTIEALSEALKRLIAPDVRYDSALVTKALTSAGFQRLRNRRPA